MFPLATFDIGHSVHLCKKCCRNLILSMSATSKRTEFYMSGQDWIQLNQFSQLANWDLLFDVNVLKRNVHGQWSPRNARQLMAFSVNHGFTNISWELGNEPNSLKHQLSKFPEIKSGKKVAFSRNFYQQSVMVNFSKYHIVVAPFEFKDFIDV